MNTNKKNVTVRLQYYIHTHIHHVHTYIHTYIHTSRTCIYTYIHTYIHTSCTYIRTYIHKHAHTYTYTHTRRLVVGYRRFGTIYRSHLQGSSSPRLLDPSTDLRCVISQKPEDLVYTASEA